MISEEQSIQLQRAGALARVAGRSVFDNPLLKPASLPASTGDDASLWDAKRKAWEIGWRAEDLMRNIGLTADSFS